MALTTVLNTPTKAVVILSNTGTETATVTLADLAIAGRQTASGPRVSIRSITIAVPADSMATITRNSEVLWKTNQNLQIRSEGWSDKRQITQNIVLTLGTTGGTIMLELGKEDGFGDNEHPYVSNP